MITKQLVYVEAIKMVDIFDLGVENEALRGKLGQVDGEGKIIAWI